MKKIITLSLLAMLCVSGFTQTVTLTFTGRDTNSNYAQLNRVEITNLTQGWQETIYWPDTTLTLQAGTGIEDYAVENVFKLSQNNPNPFNGTTDANLTVVEPGDVLIEISDVNGRIVETHNFASLQTGDHRFRIQVSAAGIYFLTARQRGQSSTVKMVNNGSGSVNSVEIVGLENLSQALPQAKSSIKGVTNKPFSFGDQMEYVGYYALYNGAAVESQHIQQQQIASEDVVLYFALSSLDGHPCREAATLTDVDGNVYNTVQIGQQCWMRENLRTTRYADNTVIPMGSVSSDTNAYRYCPGNDTNNVATYGYLYNWTAVMHNETSSSSNPNGVQGVCPNGWHVPSEAEWTQLTNYVGSQSQYIFDNNSEFIAKALASTSGWPYSDEPFAVGNHQLYNNATGFTAVPAGFYYGGIYGFGLYTDFWSSTQYYTEKAYEYSVYYDEANVRIFPSPWFVGLSVRCLRD